MPQADWSAVDDYFDSRLTFSDPDLELALAASDAAGLPPHQVSPAQGKLLLLLARLHRSEAILEVGTLGGYSTIWLARALPAGGRLISLEFEERHANVARDNLANAGLSNVATVRVGPAIDSLDRLIREESGPFDLVFIDADKAMCAEYFDRALRLSRPGTIIITDNVVRGGAVVDPSTDDESVRGIQRLMDRLHGESRCTATAIQTVGHKGHDGFCIALVESV